MQVPYKNDAIIGVLTTLLHGDVDRRGVGNTSRTTAVPSCGQAR